MNRTNALSLSLAVLGLALFAWLSYDASHVAETLRLDATLGEAGVALLCLCLSLVLLAVAALLPLRRRFARRAG